jgi:hypothetical protein
MAVTAKPTARRTAAAERKVEALIAKGGREPEAAQAAAQIKNVQLRIGTDILARIDAQRKRELVPPSRHGWMLEAILERLTAAEAHHEED